MGSTPSLRRATWFVLSVFLVLPAPAFATRYEKLVQFAADGGPTSALVPGPDGKLYGTATYGGPNGFGSVFSVDPASPSPTITILHAFTGGAGGAHPRAGLLLASDGAFYGTTSEGGSGSGTVFRITTSGDYALVASLTPQAGGSFPDTPLVEAPDGSMWGTTSRDGPFGVGIVYRVTRSGELSVTGFPLTAFSGFGGGLVAGRDGSVYGTVSNLSPGGSVFRIASNGSLSILFTFTSPSAHGVGPQGRMVVGADGNLYGTTRAGGTNNGGTVFKLLPGSGVFTLVASLPTPPAGATPGAEFVAGLAQASDGSFYGTSLRGGPFGSIFKVTSAGVVSTEAVFDGTNGASPRAPLTAVGDTFFGTASGDGPFGGDGTIFTFGPGGSPAVTTVARFGTTAGPYAPAHLIAGMDGNLYGLTANHGGTGFGSVFTMTPAGAVSTFAVLAGENGIEPTGLMQAADGSFYGTTGRGGAGSGGTIFQVSTTGAVTTLVTFTAADPADGSSPLGGVVQASDGNLYGTTSSGGANGFGTVFRVTLGAGAPTLTTLFAFDGLHGRAPSGRLVQGDDGLLYGTTGFGGASDAGTVFSISLSGELTTLVSFNGTDAAHPVAGLFKASDGNFYGTTRDSDSTTRSGRVFRLTPAGELTVFSFTIFPVTGVVEGADGGLYVASETATSATIQRIEKTGDVTMVRPLGPADGVTVRGFAVAADGGLYGITGAGGDGGGGVVFRLSNAPPVAHDVASAAAPLLVVGNDPPTQGTVTFDDPDDTGAFGAATFRIISQGTRGTAQIERTSGRFTYTANADPSGADSFVYSVTDAMGASSTATVFVIVRAIDIRPAISDIPDIAIDENGSTVPIPFTVTDPDDPESGWTITVTSSNALLAPAGAFVLTGTGSSRQLIIAPQLDRFGTATVTVTFQSRAGSVVSDTFVLTVRQVLTAPVITQQPDDGGLVRTRAVTFRSAARGEPAPSVQWQVSSDGGVTWSAAANGGQPTFVIIATPADGGKQFRAVYTNSVGTAISRAATLTARRPAFDDMDGDGISDVMVWRASTGTWFWLNSSSSPQPSGRAPVARTFGSGALRDVPLTGDLNGDGVAENLIWRPSTGTWFVSFTTSFQLGADGDVPFLGDVNGDGKADLIVWEPSTGTWRWKTDPGGAPNAVSSRQWGIGALGDQPLIGDFDGDGKTDFAVWRASNGTFYWLTSSTFYSYESANGVQWGSQAHGDVPLLGDFDGDGRSDVAVWRASTGTWFWLQSSKGYAYAQQKQIQWGNASLGDIPIVKEIDGDGADDLVVWRASTGTWYWLTSSTAYQYVNAGAVAWGSAALGDVLPRK